MQYSCMIETLQQTDSQWVYQTVKTLDNGTKIRFCAPTVKEITENLAILSDYLGGYTLSDAGVTDAEQEILCRGLSREVRVVMYDWTNEQTVERVIDKTNAMKSGSVTWELGDSESQRGQLEKWIKERAERQHGASLTLLAWEFV